MLKVNAQYNVAAAGSVPARLAAYQRRRMFEVFLREFCLPDKTMTLLDVGVTSDRSYQASNYLEAWYPHKHRIVASGVDDAGFLEQIYPGMSFTFADATALPFEDRSFDIVHSSAVIEHVGSVERQTRMISECARVCRRGFFITTPNRWFPVEFHTVLPLVHWLPKRYFQELIRRTSLAFFADEANLNLMTSADVATAATSAGLAHFSWRVDSVCLFGWPSNLLLVAHRKEIK